MYNEVLLKEGKIYYPNLEYNIIDGTGFYVNGSSMYSYDAFKKKLVKRKINEFTRRIFKKFKTSRSSLSIYVKHEGRQIRISDHWRLNNGNHIDQHIIINYKTTFHEFTKNIQRRSAK